MSNHKWLVLFLVHTEFHAKSNTNESNYIDLTNEKFYKQVLYNLKYSRPDEDMEVVVLNTILDRTKTPARYTVYVNHLKNNWFSLVDFHLPENFEIQDKNNLAFLFTAVKNKYAHDKVIIFTFGHGSAFGIFSYLPDNQNISHFYRLAGRNISLNPVIPENNGIQDNLDFLNNKFSYHNIYSFPNEINSNSLITGENNLIKIFNQDVRPQNVDYNTTVLTDTGLTQINSTAGGGNTSNIRITSNEDIAYAISASFGKVDFIIFNNCVMQNVYAQYAFKDVTDYLIAPQTGITKPGFNLKNLIGIIRKNKNSSHELISQAILEDFKNTQGLSAADISLLQLYAVIAIKLGDAYKKYVEILQEIKKTLMANLAKDDEFDEKIDDSLRLCYPYEFNTNTGKTMIDLYQFISTEKMQQIPEFYAVKTKLEKYISQDCSSYIGKNIFNQNGAVYDDQKTSGLCIYFPRNYNSINDILNPFYTSENYSSAFDQVVKWEEFIGLYLSRRKPDAG
ncbi:MAG: hypothetical protein JNM14_04315 [Ferruginibacter sp.]|nr:hypothetical protein [Ferruginibacter sp.]